MYSHEMVLGPLRIMHISAHIIRGGRSHFLPGRIRIRVIAILIHDRHTCHQFKGSEYQIESRNCLVVHVANTSVQ